MLSKSELYFPISHISTKFVQIQPLFVLIFSVNVTFDINWENNGGLEQIWWAYVKLENRAEIYSARIYSSEIWNLRALKGFVKIYDFVTWLCFENVCYDLTFYFLGILPKSVEIEQLTDQELLAERKQRFWYVLICFICWLFLTRPSQA